MGESARRLGRTRGPTWYRRTSALIPLVPVLLLLCCSDSSTAARPLASTLTVSIETSSNPVDAGVYFEAVAVVPVLPVSSTGPDLWTDSLGGSHVGPNWSLEAGTPGNLTITVQVSGGPGSVLSATVSVDVVPAPAVTLTFPLVPIEEDSPAPFLIGVTGGVLPVVVNWTASNGAGDGTAEWAQDGNYTEFLEFTTAGIASVVVRVTDALGVTARAGQPSIVVVPSASLRLLPESLFGEVGRPIATDLLLTDGTPPFRWVLSSSLPLVEGSPCSGVLPGDGVYRWNLTFADSGSTVLNLSVVDALNDVDNASVAMAIVPALAVNVTAFPDRVTAPFELQAMISGGLAPYAYRIALSDGEWANGSVSAPGAIDQTFDPSDTGTFVLQVAVSDALGASWSATRGLVVERSTTAPASGSVGAGPLLGALVVVAIAGAGALTMFRWRGTARTVIGSAPALSALPTVRAILQREQVLDRETLVVLGEEAGEPVAAISAALTHLIRTGVVTSAPGPGSDEVLHWHGRPATEAPS